MKKNVLFLSLCGILVGVGTQAQNTPVASKAMSKDKHPVILASSESSVNVNRAIIWDDDFSDPSVWTLSNSGTPSRNWVIDSLAPSGEYSASMGKILSTSRGNFAKFDSDALGSGSSVQNAVIQNTAPIDLTGHPYVLVEFESYYRKFEGACFLEVSSDGSTWTQIPLHTNITTNTNTSNPAYVSINVTSSIGGSATAYVRFRYTGGWDYAWMIDDVKIVDAPANDLILTSLSYGAYTKYPVGQERPITLWGKVLNHGAFAQTNVKLEVKESGTSIGVSPAVASLASTATDSLTATTTYQPSGVGVKNLVYTISQTEIDDVPTNNVLNTAIEITPTQFSRDNNVYSRNGYGTLLIGTDGDPVIGIGAAYELTAPAEVKSINFVLDDATNVGAEVRVELFDGSGASLVSIAESDIYTVQASDINTSSTNSPVSVTLDFFVPTTIQPGYYVAAVWQESDSVSVAYDPFNRSEDIWIYSGGSWGGLIDGGYTPLLRLNLAAPGASVKENEMTSSVSVFPNPATEFINIAFNELSGDATLTLFSTDGKQVMNKNINVTANQNTTLDVSGLSSGIYTLRVASSNGTTSKKVIIK
jgi:hypothetical protein